jgi:hypothetical protein
MSGMMRNEYIFGAYMMGTMTLGASIATGVMAAGPFFNTAAKATPGDIATILVGVLTMAAMAVISGRETVNCISAAARCESCGNHSPPAMPPADPRLGL